jgi:hypothetical protein
MPKMIAVGCAVTPHTYVKYNVTVLVYFNFFLLSQARVQIERCVELVLHYGGIAAGNTSECPWQCPRAKMSAAMPPAITAGIASRITPPCI